MTERLGSHTRVKKMGGKVERGKGKGVPDEPQGSSRTNEQFFMQHLLI